MKNGKKLSVFLLGKVLNIAVVYVVFCRFFCDNTEQIEVVDYSEPS